MMMVQYSGSGNFRFDRVCLKEYDIRTNQIKSEIRVSGSNRPY